MCAPDMPDPVAPIERRAEQAPTDTGARTDERQKRMKGFAAMIVNAKGGKGLGAPTTTASPVLGG